MGNTLICIIYWWMHCLLHCLHQPWMLPLKQDCQQWLLLLNNNCYKPVKYQSNSQRFKHAVDILWSLLSLCTYDSIVVINLFFFSSAGIPGLALWCLTPLSCPRPSWVWFCWRFHPVKIDVSLSIVISSTIRTDVQKQSVGFSELSWLLFFFLQWLSVH